MIDTITRLIDYVLPVVILISAVLSALAKRTTHFHQMINFI